MFGFKVLIFILCLSFFIINTESRPREDITIESIDTTQCTDGFVFDSQGNCVPIQVITTTPNSIDYCALFGGC